MLKMPLRALKDLFDMTESFYRGKPLSEMTKAELIKALEQLNENYPKQMDTHRHDLKMLLLQE